MMTIYNLKLIYYYKTYRILLEKYKIYLYNGGNIKREIEAIVVKKYL